MNRIYFLALISLGFILFSCADKVPCYDVTFEVIGGSTSVDSIDFRMAGPGSSYRDPDESRFYTNVSLPYSETVRLCKADFDYNLRCYDQDSTLVLTLNIYANQRLIKQKTGSPDGFIELAGGIND